MIFEKFFLSLSDEEIEKWRLKRLATLEAEKKRLNSAQLYMEKFQKYFPPEKIQEFYTPGKIRKIKGDILRINKAIDFLRKACPEEIREKFKKLKRKEKEKDNERRKRMEWLDGVGQESYREYPEGLRRKRRSD